MAQPVAYVSTHPDDVFLFRGEWLYTDLHTPGVTVHVIVPDAGDAGRTDGWWQAREYGHLQALLATVGPQTVAQTSLLINGHQVQKYTGGNFVMWCLRLPDGGLDGAGYGQGSLTELQAGTIPSLTTVDGAATYTGFGDVTATLRALLAKVRGTASRLVVNAADVDRAINPGDHPDHYAVADALQSFASADGLTRVWWQSYVTLNLAANVARVDLDRKRLLFSAYGWGADADMTTFNPLNETEWSWWGSRSYSRVDRA